MNTPIKYGHIVIMVVSVLIAWFIIHSFFSFFQFKDSYYDIKCSGYNHDYLYFIGTTSPDLECKGSDSSEFYANKVNGNGDLLK